MTAAIKVSGLRFAVRPHFWSRRRTILEEISFEVQPGELFGFLGPNGAGKTTTIKALLGLVTPCGGEISLLGGHPAHPSTRKHVGSMPEQAYYPMHLRGRELVLQHGLLAGLPLPTARIRAHEAIERVGLAHAKEAPLRSYSKGMLQRAGFAQALVADPDLLILDEPLSGLDPVGRRDMRQIMTALRQQGKTVFFSTHILPDVELVCDRVAILIAGRVRSVGAISELLPSSVRSVEVTAEHCSEELAREAAGLARHVRRRGEQVLFDTESMAQANRLLDCLRGGGAVVHGLHAHRGNLEDLFMDIATTTQPKRKEA